MYAALTNQEFSVPSAPRADRRRTSVPYCFILDDTYRVMMAGPAATGDPLASLYEVDAELDVLPGPIDRVVRALTATWRSNSSAKQASACVSDLDVIVAPLHGTDGRRIAVFIQRVAQQA